MSETTVADELAWTALPADLREQYKRALREEVERELREDFEWRKDELREEGAESARKEFLDALDDAEAEIEELETKLEKVSEVLAELRGVLA